MTETERGNNEMMKRRLWAAVLALLLLPQPFTADAADTAEASDGVLTVYESKLLRKADREILGQGSEWTDSNSCIMESDTSLELSEQYKNAAKQIKRLPLMRTAGTSLNSFWWKNSIGSMEEREKPGSSWYFSTETMNFGPCEWVKSAYAADTECEFIVGINVSSETPEMNGKYAEFMTAEKGTSSLADIRAKSGIEEPVKVFAYELGNELDNSMDVEEYCRRIKLSIAAIKKADKNAKFIACGKTYPIEYGILSDEWRNWHKTVLKEVGSDIDYISYHAYYDGVSMEHQEKYLDVIASDIKEITGSDRIKIVITEHSRWNESWTTGNKEDDKVLALAGCLSTADFLNRMYNRRDVAGANFFCFPGCIVEEDENTGEFYLTGITKLYNEYADNLGDYVVESSLSATGRERTLTAVPTIKGSDELRIVMANKDTVDAVNIDLNLEGEYTLIEKTVFTAENITDTITSADTSDVIGSVVSEENIPNVKSLSVPAKSIVFFTLKRTSTAAAQNTETVCAEESFEDCEITDSYLTGPGQKAGNFVTSTVYKGWNDSMKVKIAKEPNTDNNVLTANGGANEGVQACINYSGDYGDVSSKHFASVDIKQTHYAFNIGLRTMVHDNEKSYYEISLVPNYSKAVFKKVQNGETVVERSYDVQNGRGSGYNTLSLYMNGSKITYNIYLPNGKVWLSDTFFDGEPYELSGENAMVSLNIAGDSGDVYADNFVISNIYAETMTDYLKRSGREQELESSAREYVDEFNLALGSEAKMRGYFEKYLNKLMEYDSYLFADTDTYAKRMTCSDSALCADDIRSGLLDALVLEALKNCETAEERLNIITLERGRIGADTESRVFAETSEAVFEEIDALESMPELKAQLECLTAFEYIKKYANEDAKIGALLRFKNEYFGFDTDKYNLIQNKNALYSKLTALESYKDIRKLIDDYVPTEEEIADQTVFLDDFESNTTDESPVYGGGKWIGDSFLSSYTSIGYADKGYAMIAEDPANSENRIIKAHGCGIGYPVCLELAADISALRSDWVIETDIYSEVDSTQNGHFIFGIRGMSGNYGLNFYQIVFPEYSGYPRLEKVVNGKVTETVSFDKKIKNNTWYRLSLSIVGGHVEGKIKYKTGFAYSSAELVDDDPFEYDGSNSNLQLLVQGDGGTACFDNITVSAAEHKVYSDGDENAVLRNRSKNCAVIAAKGENTERICDGDEKNVYSSDGSEIIIDLLDTGAVDKIKMKNASINGSVQMLGSANLTKWYNIAAVSSEDVKNGDIVMCLPSVTRKYRYIKLTSDKNYSFSEISIYEAINNKIVDVFADEPTYVEYAADTVDTSGGIVANVISDGDDANGETASNGKAEFIANTAASGRVVIDGRKQFFVKAKERSIVKDENDVLTFNLGSGFYAERPNARFFAAFYDNDGSLMSIETPASEAKNKNLRAVSLKVTLPKGCERCVLFCWDELIPLTEVCEYTSEKQ